MLKDLKKEDFIKGLEELIEHLEVNEEVDLDNFNNEILKFAYSNKKPFEEVVKECALKEMKNYIDDCELDKKCNIHSVVSDYFMPDNKYGYFPNLDENLALLEQIHYEDSDLADEIVAEVKEQIRYSDESPKSELNSMVEYNYTEAGYYMEFAMQKVLEKEIMSAKELIQEIDGMEDYEIDEDLSRGDYKALYNSLAEKEVYFKEEIKRDILITKVLEKDIENKEELEKIQNEILNLKEYNCKEELSRYMIDNTVKKLLFNETTYEERQNLDFNDEFKAKIKDEINNSFNLLVKNETNNNFLMDILEDWQSGCPNLLFNHYPSYKIILDDMEIELEDKETFDIFKHSVLLVPEDKEKYWEFMNKLGYTDINEEKDFKEVKGINFNGQEEIIREKIIEIKGQEYWDNMDINNIEDWQKLQEDDIVDISYKIVHYDKKEETEYKKFENKEKTEKESYEKMFLEYFDILSNRLIFRETMKEKEYLEIEKLRDGKELNDNYKKMSLSSFENSDRRYSNKLKTDIEYNEKMIKKFNEKLIEDENYEKTLIELNKDFNEKNEAKEILKRDEKVLEKAKTEKEIDL